MSIVWSYVSIVSSLHPSLNVNIFAVVLLFSVCVFAYLFICLFVCFAMSKLEWQQQVVYISRNISSHLAGRKLT